MAKYAELPNGTRLEFPDDVKDSVMDMVVARHMAEAPSQEIDRTTGAPYGARFAIGSATDPSVQLQRARDYFGDSVRQESNGGISFIDPESGKRTMVNPTEGGLFGSGFDLGDVFGGAREIGSTVASVPAAISATALAAPSGPGALVAGAAGGAAGGAAAGQGIDAFAAYLARQKAEARGAMPSPMQSPADAAKEFGVETLLGTGGGLALGGLGKGVVKLANPMKQELVQAWRNAGQRIPSVATATGGTGGAIYENALSGMFGGTGRMQAAREAGSESLQSALDDTAARIAGGNAASTPHELGDLALQAGTRSRDAFSAESAKRYGAIETGNNRASLTNTMQTIDDIVRELSPHAAFNDSNKLMKLFEPEMADDAIHQLNAATVRNAKTRIGNLVGGFARGSNTADVEKGQLEKLYGALTRDYEASFTSPEQLANLHATNQWYSQQKSLRDIVDSIFSQDAQRTGEALLSPGRTTPDVADALRAVLDDADFNAVRGGMVRQLGRPLSSSGLSEGQASASNMARLLGSGKGAYAPEAQAVLFGQDVAAPKLMAQGMANVERSANTSRTAQTGHAMNIIKGVPALAQVALTTGAASLGDYATGVAAMAAPWGLSHLTTSPRVINYLAKPQSQLSRLLADIIAPVAGINAQRLGGPSSASAATIEPLMWKAFGPAVQNQQAQSAKAETFQEMMNRYGIKTSLDK